MEKMERYFNKADKIVFRITLLSFVWILCYKFFWIDMIPLSSNANKTADITYTVFTSIVASGIFYLFTIYIPKFYLIRRLKKQLAETVSDVDSYIGLLVSEIQNSTTLKTYTIEEFISILNNDKSKSEADFINYCNDKNNLNKILVSISFLISVLNSISLSYYRLLPDKIYNEIIELATLSLQSIEIIKIFKPEEELSMYFNTFNSIIQILKDIRSHYDIQY